MNREWLVWRISEDAVAELREHPSLAREWLIFLGPDGETRRCAPVPDHWQRLGDRELETLARQATAFAGRRE
jgi:hypothetical protein